MKIPFWAACAIAIMGAHTMSLCGEETNAVVKCDLFSDTLRVALRFERPEVLGYEHLPTGMTMGGGGARGLLVVNGKPIPWSDWSILSSHGRDWSVYGMKLKGQQLKFEYAFALKDSALEISIRNIVDPDGFLRTLGWQDMPVLTCRDPAFSYWKMIADAPDPNAGGKMWTRDAAGQVRAAEPQDDPVILGCLYRPDKLCVFIDSNYPLFPQAHQLTAAGEYRLALNTYQYRVRSRTMPPLKAQVVFLQDINGDGKSDLSDYSLWVNRRLPGTDSLYRTHIWYKILNEEPTAGVRATFKQSEEIIRAIHNVTDGLPQMVYLVGWQYDGHDTGYPAMDRVNAALGGEEGLRSLIDVCRNRYATLVSYHCNIDDTYANRPAHDPSTAADNGNISHCLDVESGKIFKKLDAMMRVAPVERTIHFDNTRITSRVAAQGIGVMEELECGLRPIDEYLKAKGITMSTEGWNGIPISLTGLFSALWHYDPPRASMQIWHGKLMGGGWGAHAGPQSRFELGLGGSIHQDITYFPIDRETLGEEVWKKSFTWLDGPLSISFTKDWDDMVERIYLGTLLYHFYLERELTEYHPVPGGVRQVYGAREVVVENANNRLKATMGDVVVADDDERFIPRGDAIYAYSLAGSERDWVLPGNFRGRALKVVTLGKDGRGPAPAFKLEKDRIHLALAARTPVKIMISEEQGPAIGAVK